MVFVSGASAQTTANQDGILILDAVGRAFSANDSQVGIYLFKELEGVADDFDFGLSIFQDIEWVADETGHPVGAYALDKLGGQYSLTLKSAGDITMPTPMGLAQASLAFKEKLYDKNYLSRPDQPEQAAIPFWGFDVARDIEVAPDWRLKQGGFSGYFLLDADGAVHSVGPNNLPVYAYPGLNGDGTIISDTAKAKKLEAPFPATIDIDGSGYTPEGFLKGGVANFPVNRAYYDKIVPGQFYQTTNPQTSQLVKSVTPVYLYFGLGSDIARDMEVSAEFVQITVPTQNGVQVKTIAMTNGYYVMDGLGGVHSNRLALDFDVMTAPDGVYYADMVKDPNKLYENLTKDDLRPEFGRPINNAVLAEPWFDDRANLPYFGVDIAVDMELTPSGKGFYLLDMLGGVHAVGDAKFTFPPNPDGTPTNFRTPYFNFPIARDLVVVGNKGSDFGIPDNTYTAGYIVLDGFGNVYTAGLAKDYNIKNVGDGGEPIFTPFDLFRSVETSPVWLAAAPTTTPTVANFKAVSGPSSVSTKLKVGFEGYDFSVAPNFRVVTAAFTNISAPNPN
ncbi:MAG: hypothetical protein GC154_09410 [bacterium]|nr:hypothetical protein [bacterium]